MSFKSLQKIDEIDEWRQCTYGNYWTISDVTSEDYTKAAQKCSGRNLNPQKGNRGGNGGRGGNAGTPGKG